MIYQGEGGMSNTINTGAVMVVFIARCNCQGRGEEIYIDAQTEGT